MTEYCKQLTIVGRSILDKILSRNGKIHPRLGYKNNIEVLILNLSNIYYLLNSLCNLVSLGILNNSSIYHNNKFENLYQINFKKVLA